MWHTTITSSTPPHRRRGSGKVWLSGDDRDYEELQDEVEDDDYDYDDDDEDDGLAGDRARWGNQSGEIRANMGGWANGSRRMLI